MWLRLLERKVLDLTRCIVLIDRVLHLYRAVLVVCDTADSAMLMWYSLLSHLSSFLIHMTI